MYVHLRISIETERVKRYHFGLGGSNEPLEPPLVPPEATYLCESSGKQGLTTSFPKRAGLSFRRRLKPILLILHVQKSRPSNFARLTFTQFRNGFNRWFLLWFPGS